jgi:hypothetical protein
LYTEPTHCTIETIDRTAFDFLDPKIEMLDLFAMARALSNQCRFAGHVDRFYSVAEHSVRGHDFILEHFGDAEMAHKFLFHDGSEYVLVDIPRPLKRFPGIKDAYYTLEAKVQDLVWKWRNLPPGMTTNLIWVDNLMLSTEREYLRAAPIPELWGDLPEPLPPEKFAGAGWSPDEAFKQFLQRVELYG